MAPEVVLKTERGWTRENYLDGAGAGAGEGGAGGTKVNNITFRLSSNSSSRGRRHNNSSGGSSRADSSSNCCVHISIYYTFD